MSAEGIKQEGVMSRLAQAWGGCLGATFLGWYAVGRTSSSSPDSESEEKESSEAQPAEGGSMKLWLKGISGPGARLQGMGPRSSAAPGTPCPLATPDLQHHFLPVTQGSLWLLREPQGSCRAQAEVRASQTCSFILDIRFHLSLA